MHAGDDCHSHSHSETGERRLLWALFFTGAVMVAELAGGLIADSLALVADAGHMLVDLLALGVAYASLAYGRKPADAQRTYGYKRLEVVAALCNCLMLVGLSGAIVVKAIERLLQPSAVQSDTMLVVAVLGLVANLIGLRLLGHGSHNMSVRGAFLHLLGDTLSSVAAIVGAWLIGWTGYTQIDPILSILISVVICLGSLRLLRDALRVLLEAAPPHLSTDEVRAALESVAGVQRVHDLHVWSITQTLPALSAHLVLRGAHVDPWQVLRAAQTLLAERFSLHHVTLQIERSESECDCSMAVS